MDEEAILDGLRSGEDLPDYDYEGFEAGSTGQDRRGEDPGRDTPRGRGRYADNGDDRIFRQATDDEQTQRVYSDRSGSESGHRRGRFDFVSMAMDMARPHSDDPEAMPIRPPRSLVPGESQVSDEFESRPQGPGTMVLVPGGLPGRSTGSQNPGQSDEHEERKFSDFGYDDLLKSTAGWGSSSKQGSDAGRPNPNTAKSESYDDEGYNFADEEESMQAAVRLQGLVPPLPSLRSMMMTSMPRLRIAVMRRRTNHDGLLGSVMLRGPGASLMEPPGTFALTGMPEAREREPGTVGKFFGDWRPSMTVRDR